MSIICNIYFDINTVCNMYLGTTSGGWWPRGPSRTSSSCSSSSTPSSSCSSSRVLPSSSSTSWGRMDAKWMDYNKLGLCPEFQDNIQSPIHQLRVLCIWSHMKPRRFLPVMTSHAKLGHFDLNHYVFILLTHFIWLLPHKKTGSFFMFSIWLLSHMTPASYDFDSM